MNHRIFRFNSTAQRVIAAFLLFVAGPAAAQTITINPVPYGRTITSSLDERVEEGGWVGFSVTPSGSAPMANVTVNCNMFLNSGTLVTHFRADGEATEPFAAGSPLPNPSIDLGPSNWPAGETRYCEFWTHDNLAVDGARTFRIQASITGPGASGVSSAGRRADGRGVYNVEITDNDATTPTGPRTLRFFAVGDSVAEGRWAVFDVVLSRPQGQRLRIPYTITPTTPGNGITASDFTAGLTGTFEIDDTAAQGGGVRDRDKFQIQIADSEDGESAESFTVTLGAPLAPAGANEAVSVTFLQRSATKTILADATTAPDPVTISVSVSPTTVAEGNSVNITFTLSQAYAGDLSFGYTITGAADSDFISPIAGNHLISVPSGQTSVTVPRHVVVDGEAEAAETVTVTIRAMTPNRRFPGAANPPLQVSATAGSATFDIEASTDTEPAAAAVATSVAITGTPSAAPTENAEFTVSLMGLRRQPATVNYEITAAQTNAATVHYFDASAGAAFPVAGTLTLPPGTDPSATLSIPILVPGAGAMPGGFVVTLASVQFAEDSTPTAVTGKTATGTVTAGTSVALSRVTPSAGEVPESSTPVTYSVQYTGPELTSNLVVAWAVSAPAGDDPDGDGPITAAEGRDFDQSDFSFPDGSVTINSGRGGSGPASVQFTVGLQDELVEEGPEYFIVTISVTSPSDFPGYLASPKHTSVIAANDTPIPLTVSFVQRSGALTPAASLSVAESAADPADTANTNHFICVGITELPDGVTDIGATQVLVNVDATAGSAGADEFSIASNQQAIIEQGSHRNCVQLTVNNDMIPEDAETLTVSMRLDSTFSRLAGAVTFGPAATVTITDADPIVIALDASAYTVEEGESVSVTAVITTPPATTPIEIADWSAVMNLATSVESGDTAAQSDFTAAAMDFTFTNAARRHALRITTLEHPRLAGGALSQGMQEPNETFTVTLTENPATDRVTVGAADTAAVTILDNDNLVWVRSAVNVSEGDGDLSWMLGSTSDLAEGAVVTYQLETDFLIATDAADRATAADLTPPSGTPPPGAFPIILTYTIAAGDTTGVTNGVGGVTINTGYGVRDDNLNEGQEVFRVTILSATGAFPANLQNSDSVTIAADSADATVIDSIALTTPLTPREGDDVYFTVQLSGGVPTEAVNIAWTRSGDAEAADFAAIDTSPLSIPAGQMWGRIFLRLATDADTGDTTVNDGFTITLSATVDDNTDGGGDGVSLTATTADQSASVTSITAARSGADHSDFFVLTGGSIAEPSSIEASAGAAVYGTANLFLHYYSTAGDGTRLATGAAVGVSIVPADGSNNPIEHNAANGTAAAPPATQGDIWRVRTGDHMSAAFAPAAATNQGFPTAADLRGPIGIRDFENNATTFRANQNIDSCGTLGSRAGCRPSNAEQAELAGFGVYPNADNLNEGDEHFWMYLTTSRGRVSGPHLITITDNADDALTVAIAPSADADGNAVAGGTGFDEGGRARFTVSISGATSTEDVVVDYAISGANITAGDFTGIDALTGHSVTIPAGRASSEIVLNLAEDETLELAEAFTVTLSNPRTAGAISVGAATASLGISADPAGEAAITLTAHAARNDVGSTVNVNLFRVQLHRAGDTGTAMTFGQNVRLTATHGGTACQGALGGTCGSAIPDYSHRNAGGVTWGGEYVQLAAGRNRYDLPGTIRGDPFNEPDETIVIVFTGATALAAGASEYTAMDALAIPSGGLSTTFTITNDDALTVTLVPNANAAEVAEGGSTNLRIELRGGGPHSGTPMTIAWAVRPTTSTSDLDAGAADFTAVAGGTTGLANLPSGSFSNAPLARLDAPYNGVFTGGRSPSVRVVNLHITDESLPDGDKNFDIVVTITGAGSADVTFASPFADRRAHYAIDPGRDQQRAFTLSGPTVNGAAAASVNEDAAAAADRTVTYTVTYTAHADAADAALTGAATLTLTLGADADPATRDVQLGGPGVPNDFTAPTARTVTFDIGDMPGTAKTATFVIANDNRSEKAETFTVTLGGLAEDEGIDNAYINTDSDAHIATAEIAASDAIGWELQALATTAAEPATPADPADRPAATAFYFRLAPSVSLDTGDATHAILGNDNLERVSLTLEIQTPAGAATVLVDADGDGNHDTAGQTPDYRAGTLAFTGATALSAADITGDTVESVTVTECANAICARVEVLSDDLNEAAETINLRVVSLSALQSNFNALNADPAHASRNAVITIAANDPLTVAIGNAPAVNEGAPLQFPLTITGGTPSAPLQFTFGVAGSGITDADFTGVTASEGSFTLTPAAAAGTPTLDLPTVRDNTAESAETVSLTLATVTAGPGSGTVSLAGSVGGNARRGDGIINASVLDVRRLLAARDTATGASEGASTCFSVRIEALNAGDTNFGFTSSTDVNWAVAHGDGDPETDTAATTDADFTAAGDLSGSVTFAAGDTADKMVCIDIRTDGLNEASEYFRITVSLADEDADGGTEVGDPPVISAIDPPGDDITVTLSAPTGPLTEAENLEATFTVALSGGVRTGDVVVPLTFSGLDDADFDIGTPTGIDASATSLTITFPGPDPTASPPFMPPATDSMQIVLDFHDNDVNEAVKTVRMANTPGEVPRSVGDVSYSRSDPEDFSSALVNFAEVELQDDDPITFSVTPASGMSVSEGATHTITLTPSGATSLAAAVTVGWTATVTQSTTPGDDASTDARPDLAFVGTATPAGGVTAGVLSGRQVVWQPGVALAAMTVEIRPLADAFKESAESVAVAFTRTVGAGGGMVTAPASHQFSIAASEAAARTITAAATTTSVAEGEEITVTATDDATSESAETVTLTLTDPCARNVATCALGGRPTSGAFAVPMNAAATLTATAVATATIAESDRPVTVGIAAPGDDLVEGTAANFTVSFAEDITTTAGVTVTYAISFPDATASVNPAVAADFTGALTGRTVQIPAGDNSVDLSLTAVDDAIFESDETFIVTLTAATGGGAIAAPVLAPATPAMDGDPVRAATAAIAESDPVTVSINNPGNTVREGADAEFTVSLALTSGGAAATTAAPICVTYRTAVTQQGTANSGTNGPDIAARNCDGIAQTVVPGTGVTASGGVQIAAGAGSATLAVATLYDALDEGATAEALSVTLTAVAVIDSNNYTYPALAVAASPASAGTVNIQNVDSTRSITIAGPGTVGENENILFTVTIDGEPVTAQFALTWTLGTDSDAGTTDATLSGANRDTSSVMSANLPIPVSAERRQQHDIEIVIIDDARPEPDEVLTLTLTDPCAGMTAAACGVGGRPAAFSAAPGVSLDTATAAATIGESDQAVTLQIAAPANALEESLRTTQAAASGAFTVSFAESVTTTADIQVQWRLKFPQAVAGGDATRIVPASLADFASATRSGTATIPAGMNSATITVTTAADHIQEPVETFAVELHGTPAGGGAIVGDGLTLHTTEFEDTATIARSDDGGISGMTIDMVSTAMPTQNVDEGAAVTFSMRLFNNTQNEANAGARATASTSSVPICVTYTVAITMQRNPDGQANTAENHDVGGITDCDRMAVAPVVAADGATVATGGVLIPAGSNRQSFTITARFDNIAETANEEMVVRIASATPPMNSGLSAIHFPTNQNTRRAANIRNINSARALSITGPGSPVDEGGNMEFTVTVTGRAITTPFDVLWEVTTGAGEIDAATTAVTGSLRFTEIGSQTIRLAVADDALSEAAEMVTVRLTDPCPSSGVCGVGGRTGITSASTPALQLTGASASGTVAESDRPVTVGIAAPAGDLSEGTASNFAVSFPESVTTSALVMVNYAISFPAASTTVNPAVTADFASAALTGSIDIPAGMSTVNLAITALDDAVFEADEDFTVTLTSVSGGGAIAAPVLAASPMASAKIDQSDPVTVSIARASGQGATVVEGGTARFTVSLALTSDTTMTATAGAPVCVVFGTAVNQQMTANTAGQGADITVANCAGAPQTVVTTTGSTTGGVRIPAGASSATLNIGALYDGHDEGTTAETLAVTLSSAADEDANFTYPAVTTAASPGNVASVGITNVNAARSVTVAAPDAAVAEDAGTFDFTVTVTGQAVTQAFDIPWTITAGSATVSGAGADISSATTGTLRVPASSQSEQTLTIAVTVSDDATAENDETLMLALTDICAGRPAAGDGGCNFGGRPAGGDFDSAPAVVVSTAAATATIGQSDQTVTLQIAAPGNLSEGTAADFTVRFTESVTTTSDITFSWTNNPGVTATGDTAAAADFAAAGLTGSATILAGQSSVTVPITARADNHSEGPETFTVAISSPTGGGAIVGSGLTVSTTAGTAQATIAASDPVTVSIARRAGQTGDVVEGSYAEFTVSLALVSDTTMSATAANPICVTFRAEVSGQQTPANDAASGADLEVRDCAGMTVTVAVANSQTTAGGALIPAGMDSAPLRVLVRYDDIDEGMTDEGLVVQITSAAFQPALTGATVPVIGSSQQVSVNLENTNALRTVAASTPTATVQEDHAAYLFQITLAGSAPVSPVTVAWTVTDAENNPAAGTTGISDDGRAVRNHGGAHGPADFTGPATGSVTFRLGDTAAKDVVVRARNDAYNEGAETLTVTLTDPCPAAGLCEVGGRAPADPQGAPALALSRATSTVQIAASDPIALSIASGPTALVAGEDAVYTLHFGCANGESGDGCREVIPTTDLTVPLTVTVGGMAVTVADRTVPVGSRTFTLTAAEINAGGENHGQTLSVTLGAPTGLPGDATATVAATATAIETAVRGWTLALTADRVSAPEGSAFDFVITLRGAASELGRAASDGITVPWAITGAGDNAARVDTDDFVGALSGTVEFAHDSPMSRTVTVQTARNDDDNPDSDTEMFAFTIGALQGGSPRSDGGGDAANAEIAGADSITATVGPPVDEDVAALNRVIMPEVARAIADSQMNAVAGRLRGGFDGGDGDGYGLARAPRAPLAQVGGQSTLSGLAAEQMQALADDDVDWKRIAAASKFEMPLGAGHGRGSLAAGTFWGGGELRGIGGKSGDTDWSGDLFSAHLGFDARLNRDLLSGLLLSYSEADIDDYTRVDSTRSSRPTVAGDWLLDMTSLSPYLNWRGARGVEGWALASFGRGELAIDERGGRRASDVELQTFGLGLSGEVLRAAGREVRARAEAFATAADIDDSKTTGGEELGVIPGDDLSARRVRVLLELRRSHALAGGAHLDNSGEFGARYDSGDGRTGGGIELGGGAAYHNAAAGLTLEARSRGLLAHSADYEDWGVSGSVKLAAGADGQGLSLALSPAYGNAGGARGVWDGGVLAAVAGDGDGDDARDLRARMDLRAGYGMRAFTATGLLTPFSGMSFADNLQSYQLGIEWQHRDLRLKFSGQRLDADDTTHGVLFKGEMKF